MADILNYADVIPHYNCKHCNDVNILLNNDQEVFKWLTMFSEYHKVEGKYTCKHCNKKFIYFWALATHLMMEEYISCEKIMEHPKSHFTADINKKLKSADKTAIPFARDSEVLYVPEKPHVSPNFEKVIIQKVKSNFLDPQKATESGEKRKWTDEEITILIKMKNENVSGKEMAKCLNRSEATIYSKISQLMKAGKIEKKTKMSKITDAEFDECIEQNKKDLSENKKPSFEMKFIAETFGVQPWAIYRYIDTRFGKGQNIKKLLGLTA